MQHSYGYIPDKEDSRDYSYKFIRKIEQPLPTSIDLRKFCSPVRDQGQLGACTGFATTALREFLFNKLAQQFIQMSPLFLYYEERKLEFTILFDAGASIRDGMKVLLKMGCAPEIDDPYDISKFRKAPSKKAIQNAKKFIIGSYNRLSNLYDLQVCLAHGNGVVLGIKVYQGFEEVDNKGIVPMPEKNEKSLGRHAIFCVGYQTDTKFAGGGYLIIKNSWGSAFGDKGYVYIPWQYIVSNLASDMWTALP